MFKWISSLLFTGCSRYTTYFSLHLCPTQQFKILLRLYLSMPLMLYSGCCQACTQVGAAGSDPLVNNISAFRDACWRFLRPHTIRGTALGSV